MNETELPAWLRTPSNEAQHSAELFNSNLRLSVAYHYAATSYGYLAPYDPDSYSFDDYIEGSSAMLAYEIGHRRYLSIEVSKGNLGSNDEGDPYVDYSILSGITSQTTIWLPLIGPEKQSQFDIGYLKEKATIQIKELDGIEGTADYDGDGLALRYEYHALNGFIFGLRLSYTTNKSQTMSLPELEDSTQLGISFGFDIIQLLSGNR